MKLPVIKAFLPLYKKTTDGAVEEWSIKVDGPTPEGYGVMVTTYGHVGGKKQETEDVVKVGKNSGRKNATSAVEQALAEAESRWTKKRDRKQYGLDATGKESSAKRALAPMLAQSFKDRAKHVDWETAFAQPKLDGYRCLIRFEAGGPVAVSREGKILKVPHITDMLKEALPDDDVVLDGELYCHGLSLNKIGSLCKRLQPDTTKVRLHLYDAVLDVSYAKRYAHIKEVSAHCDRNIVDLTKTVKVRSAKDLDVVEAECIEEGYEGAMLRFGRLGYQPGQRSACLLKVKRFDDSEFKVVDYKFGRGKYEGIPVFVCKTADGDLFNVTAPGDLEEKRALGATAKDYVGKTLKVKFAGYTNTDEPVPFQPVAIEFVE